MNERLGEIEVRATKADPLDQPRNPA
jgi:hypothetical protein